MKSPFPGMDPYLEEWWRDVHHSLCTYARDALQGQLGSDLRARVDERLVVEADEMGRSVYPDVRIVERIRPEGQDGGAQPATAVAVDEPILIDFRSEPARQGYIEILDVRHGGRVISVIEFLSPSNRIPGDARDQYLRKQGECVAAGVNLVEIDLVRAGYRVTLSSQGGRRRMVTPYQVCVFRASKAVRLEVYPIRLDSRLPRIHVPLRTTDPDAVLDLQALVEQAYELGRYADELDYREPCEPPLEGDEAAWAEGLLKQAGKRPA